MFAFISSSWKLYITFGKLFVQNSCRNYEFQEDESFLVYVSAFLSISEKLLPACILHHYHTTSTVWVVLPLHLSTCHMLGTAWTNDLAQTITEEVHNAPKGTYNPVSNYLFKVNTRNTRTRCEICSKSSVSSIVNFFYCRLGTVLSTGTFNFAEFFLLPTKLSGP